MASINGEKVNNARLCDPSMFIQAGISPKSGLPIKAEEGGDLKGNIKRLLRIVDEQDALNRYVWYNLPNGLSGQLLERILYYRGQGMFFYIPTNDSYYFLPYTLDGNLDVYGRFTGVTPVPFQGELRDEEKGKTKPWIQGLKREPLYEVMQETSEADLGKYCVLLGDYSKQWAQTVIPRFSLQESVLDVMADCIPFCRTALQNSTGISGFRVNSADEYSLVNDANRAVNRAALEGKKYIPIIGSMDFQQLTGDNVGKTEEFMLAMQSFDNFRLSLYGLENGGLFEKKAQELQAEQALNSHKSNRIYQDGLTLRQEFCDIVNSWTGLGISCEPAESEVGDLNGDMMEYDDFDQSGTMEGNQPDVEVSANVD